MPADYKHVDIKNDDTDFSNFPLPKKVLMTLRDARRYQKGNLNV